MLVYGDIFDAVYSEGPLNLATTDQLNRAILCPTNEEVFRVNEQVLRKLEGEEVTYIQYLNVTTMTLGGDTECSASSWCTTSST